LSGHALVERASARCFLVKRLENSGLISNSRRLVSPLYKGDDQIFNTL
jgi:hypothetical protein